MGSNRTKPLCVRLIIPRLELSRINRTVRLHDLFAQLGKVGVFYGNKMGYEVP